MKITKLAIIGFIFITCGVVGLPSATMALDTLAPAITQATPVPTPTNDTTPNYTFYTTEAGKITYGGSCGSLFTTVSSAGYKTITFNNLTQGTYSNCTIMVTDAAGNKSNILRVNTFTIDLVAPDTTITAMPAKQSSSASASFSFTASEAGTFQCKLDSGTYAACASPKTYSLLTEGAHTFYVKAIDSAGNQDITSAVYYWTITYDKIAPETTITATPTKQSTSASANFSFTSTEAGTFQCKLDSGIYANCTSPKSYGSLTEGVHTFYVKAIDNAGNVDLTPAVYSWTIAFDIIAPETTITSMPAKQSTSANASFSFTASEAGTFQCKLDSGTYAACASPKTYSLLTEGAHTFYVKAIDSAGNMDITPAVYYWTITYDIVAPETTITAMPAKQTYSASASFSFISTETGTFQCKLDSGTYAVCASPKIYSSLTDGSHTFYVKAIDNAGNMDVTPAVYFWTVTIDTTAPETTITSMPAKQSTSANASFSFTASEAGTFQCKLDSGIYANCTSPIAYNSLTDGQHVFYVKAIDNAGNMDITPAVYAWTVAVAPETTITDMPAKQSSSADASFSFTASEAGTFQCKLDSETYIACTSPKTYSSLAEGSHTFYVKAIDSAGNMDVTPAVYAWTIIIAPETTITMMPAKQATSSNASFSFTSTKAGTFQCKLDSGTYAACTSPTAYSSLAEGAHTFYVKAIDSAGNMDVTPAVYAWTITIAPETTITAMPAKQTTSTDASFSFTASEASTFQCKLDSGTYAACTSPTAYSSLTAGQHIFYVKAIDSSGHMDVTPAVYAWTITAPIL